MSSLSETLTFLATRQIVAGSREVLGGLYRQHAAAMYRELWTLATDHRKSLTAKDVRDVQAGIDGFFGRLEGEGVPVEGQIIVLRQFYALLLVLRVAELLDALGGGGVCGPAASPPGGRRGDRPRPVPPPTAR